MTKNKRNEVLVGAFVTGAMLLFVLLLFLMGTLDGFFSSSTTVYADFGDIQRLQVGDPVWLFGNRLGKVASAELLPKEPGKRAVVRVGLRLPSQYRSYLRADSIVKIERQITGNISVIIQETDGASLVEGSILTGSPSEDLATLSQKINLAVDEGRQVVKSVSRMLGELESRGDMTRAFAEARGLLENLNVKFVPLGERLRITIEELQGLLAENRIDLRHTVANLREMSGASKSLLEKLSQTPDQLARGLAELEKAGSAVGTLVRDNRPHVDTILEDLRAAMTNASNLTSEVKRRPWRLLYRPSEDELKAMDLYDAAWAYNLGATELNRSIRDLTTRLEKDPASVKPELLEEARQQVAHSLRKHREAEEQFWARLKSSE